VTKITDLIQAGRHNAYMMRIPADSRRVVLLVLAIAVWVHAAPAMSPSAALPGACHGMSHAAAHGAQFTSHHCCPPRMQAGSGAPAPVVISADARCYDDCCTQRRQPSRALAFLSSDDRQSADSARRSKNRSGARPTAMFELPIAPSHAFTKLVFNLKSDLRI
jgi:hypothetical protein